MTYALARSLANYLLVISTWEISKWIVGSLA